MSEGTRYVGGRERSEGFLGKAHVENDELGHGLLDDAGRLPRWWSGHVAWYMASCFHNLGVLFVGDLMTKALPIFALYRAPDLGDCQMALYGRGFG